ncbi:MAG: hypothetical protein Q4E61_03030, partial [Alphaproteobacteria bacterium]|nr:hypothetical protein [Alphaproteobacteria bacterium]
MDFKKNLKNALPRVLWMLLVGLIIVIIVVLFCAAALDFDVENGIFTYSDDGASGTNNTDTSESDEYTPKAYLNSVYVTEKGTLMPEMSIDDLWEHDNRYKTYLSNKNQLAYLLNAQLVSQYPYIYTEGTDEDEKDTDITFADLNGTIKFYRNGSTDFMKYVSAEQLE